MQFKVWPQFPHEESLDKEDNEEIMRDIARIMGKSNGYHISDNAQEFDSLPKRIVELIDTISVAQDLPSIAFTPVIVAESKIKGIEIHV